MPDGQKPPRHGKRCFRHGIKRHRKGDLCVIKHKSFEFVQVKFLVPVRPAPGKQPGRPFPDRSPGSLEAQRILTDKHRRLQKQEKHRFGHEGYCRNQKKEFQKHLFRAEEGIEKQKQRRPDKTEKGIHESRHTEGTFVIFRYFFRFCCCHN